MIWSLQYWKNTAELVLRGAAIGAVTSMGGSAVDAWHLPWKVIAGMALSGALLSLLTSLASLKVGDKGSPLMTAVHGWNPAGFDPTE